VVLQVLAWIVAANLIALDNEYVVVTRGATPFASAHAGFAERVIVALGDIEITDHGQRRALTRGDIAVFGEQDEYEPPSGSFFEVAIRRDHPAVKAPAEIIPPEKNAIRYDGKDFFVFEEKLAPGDTRARHSHSQRVVIQLNSARLQQWPDNGPSILVDTVPERVSFNAPVVHTVKNVGEIPLRGIIIEFKPATR
jgi:hypothetical protein